MTKSCKICLYDENHPFGLYVNADGICTGCLVHQEKNHIDWDERKELLTKKINKHRDKHDCVIYVDSDAESYYVVYLTKVILGYEPLLVTFNDHLRTELGNKNLNNLKTIFDCDLLTFTPKLSTFKNVIKESFMRSGNFYWPIQAAKTALPVRVAIQKKIPFVFWGGHQGIEQVGMFSHYDEVNMSKWYRDEHDLFQLSSDKITSGSSIVSISDIELYQYPKPEDLIERNIKGIYLSNYFLWDPLRQNNEMTKFGYTPEYTSSTFDYFDRSGSSIYYNIHDITRKKRVGYYKVRDHLCREIRHGRLDRNEAIKIENFYNKQPREYQEFFNWLGMSNSASEWLKTQICQEEAEKNCSNKIILPKKLEKFCPKPEVSEKKFSIFDKSLYLKSQVKNG